jgi:hypothetical protein
MKTPVPTLVTKHVRLACDHIALEVASWSLRVAGKTSLAQQRWQQVVDAVLTRPAGPVPSLYGDQHWGRL